MKLRKNFVTALLVGGSMAAISGQASAHSYYNLTGSGAVASGNSAVGFGIANSINGTDGVSNNSNSTNRIANGTNTYDPLNPGLNNLISGTGTPAASVVNASSPVGTHAEVTGNLPYMWYSGQHSTAAGVTKRELYTGSAVGDTSGNLFAQTISGANPVTPGGIALPGTNATWGVNNLAGEWNAYNAKNTGANAATWGTIMTDLPANGDHPYLAVSGNSATTGLGLDYGLIHISCSPNTAINNCVSSTPLDTNGNPTGPTVGTGDLLTTITLANDTDYSQYNGLLDVALYRGVDTSASSDRNGAATIGDTNIQGSSLGQAIWTAGMSSSTDILSYSFIFNQAEWDATDSFYTLVVGAHNGSATSGVTYDVMVTTSAVPVPGAVWLFGSAMAGLIGFGRRKLQLAA